MDSALFLKYKIADYLLNKAVSRINPCYEIATLFCKELNKTAGQKYISKSGRKGKTKFYTEQLVLKELKAINKDEGVMFGFYNDCLKSSLGFRFYYCAKLKNK